MGCPRHDVAHRLKSIDLDKGRPTFVASPQNYLAVIKVVGIGGGGDCDGQVLVTHDMLGITSVPRGVSTVSRASIKPIGPSSMGFTFENAI